MVQEQLLTYIKSSLAAGYSEAQIREAARQAEWSDADINEAFITLRMRGINVSAPYAEGGKSISVSL